MSITVFTSICGGKDELVEQTVPGKFVAYLDHLQVSDTWEVKSAYDKFSSPRRNSRVPKILAHQYINTEYSIWIDGNIKLLLPPEELIEKYLSDCDFATFKHPKRDCLYEEAIVCAKRGLDHVETIIEQVKGYEDGGFAKHKGLGENMMILRRHTPKVEMFNNYWWSEYCRHSVRDQLSFPYTIDKVGLRVKFINEQFEEIEGKYIRGGLIEIVSHKHFKNENIS